MTFIEKLFLEVKNKILVDVMINSPYRTGQMMNSFKLVTYNDGFGIKTDIGYMIYVESLKINGRENAKKWNNYNYHWLLNLAIRIAEELNARLRGTMIHVIK